tara:strand:+ start:113 stop:292 length:180 start_codon:yes stop_codon:yes gene_type:complete
MKGDHNLILSYATERGTKVLSHAYDGYVYEVKDRTITRKVVLSHIELIAAIDQYITENS